MTTDSITIYERIGGKAAVTAVVDDFYQRVLGDPQLAPFFEHTDTEQLRQHQVSFVSVALGASELYDGKGMKEAHAGRGIGNDHFDSVATHLSDSLRNAGVGEDDITAIISKIASLRGAVVE